MHLKRQGTVLISSMVILALMSILGFYFFRMMRNNIELGSLYNLEKDRYDLDSKEEEILYGFMEEINKNTNHDKDNNNNDFIGKNILIKDFKKDIGDSNLEYIKAEDKLYLTNHIDDEITRKREINYFFKEDKLILVPTYKFEDKNK